MIKSLDEQQYSTATIGAPLISSAKLQFFRDNAKHSNGYFGTSMGMLEKSRREKIFFRRDFLFSRLFLFAQHERILTGASPQAALTVGRLQPKARVSTVRWNLKEALGKHLTRRTET